MVMKLSQPGCHANTGANREGRRKLIVLPDVIPIRQGPEGRSSTSVPVPQGRSSSRVPVPQGRSRSNVPVKKKPMKEKRRMKLKEPIAPETPLRPFSADPREDIQDALTKFRALSSKSSTVFRLLHPDHAVWRLRNLENDIPGIAPGQRFRNRVELFIVGLHGHLRRGIHTKELFNSNGRRVSIALSVLLSGRYEDDEDHGETIYYTGEGGNDLSGTGKQERDQKMRGGNAALINSFVVGNSIRVIRSRSGGFSYSGLYEIKEWIPERGISNFIVLRFKLTRLPGQARLAHA